MTNTVFNGQQEGERIFYTIKSHALGKYVAVGRTVVLSIFFVFVMYMIGTIVPQASVLLHGIGFLLAILLIIGGYFWNVTVYAKDKTYITDRRIIRFDVVSPILTTKRSLFWNEVMKTKSFVPNFLYRMLHVGTVTVEPLMADHEDVTVTHVYLYEDVANYIDKILYTVKNKPTEIESFRPFVPRSKGQRS